jgi:GT2 family glycosyltransferase
MADSSTTGTVPAVTTVVVTYGHRLHLLEPTLDGIAAQPAVRRLLVVDNGSAPAVGEWLARYGATEPRLTVVRRPENLGSAGGFRAGLSAAAASDGRFVWLLDDDTQPEPGAAAALLEAWPTRDGGSGLEPIALLSQRWEAERYRRESAWSVNAAFGVDLFDAVRQRFCSRGNVVAPAPETGPGPVLTVRMAPWSGLFFERALIDRIGLPDERFITYEEDHEFTLRITARGGRIIVVPESRLTTLEPSWLDDRRSRFVSSRLKPRVRESAESRLDEVDRVYYGARNRVYLETRHLVSNRFRYCPNLGVFVGRVVVSGLGAANRRNTRWFLAGVFDGLRGRLGRRRTA